jgi:hypothetical protein
MKKVNQTVDIVADKKIEVISEVSKARERIERAMDQDGPFTHNMIGLTLSGLADKVGVKYANELVREFELDEIYGIQEVEEK